ncbi:MAG: hypothetical protein EXQ74_04925 [Thermoleophilia bacterium]|nr:hypothetical protein [Thermoleophilia bacterium]
MSTQASAGGIEDVVYAVDGLAEALGNIQGANDVRRMVFSKGENTRHIRLEQVLQRWPILSEDWARKIEDTRISSVDRTPGAATFGR